MNMALQCSLDQMWTALEPFLPMLLRMADKDFDSLSEDEKRSLRAVVH